MNRGVMKMGIKTFNCEWRMNVHSTGTGIMISNNGFAALTAIDTVLPDQLLVEREKNPGLAQRVSLACERCISRGAEEGTKSLSLVANFVIFSYRIITSYNFTYDYRIFYLGL